ncbi:30S ribosomal protein S6 modification protein RimK [Streptomyces eurocidicus]|uniref:30S ribosomal protein S6 modification protein RimK n=1 Tax=Streptomyces eurocidicus TaxID=66423 RepID=A0A2N8NRA0_STREU|nr:ATP-grasp ribosomal peptide maturase [Streptomyces eurocidicus]MBB5117077.1 ATP-grasp ribosomal peptide maturase [Streptomyces eurocidicus]MBF6052626.1 ATP-grasp ribosomal peptide maturase [Streptomyces eurocidicus]PNE31283.1 30S ribosomal protein S6 modification protein RimK [Streptomyces eurocidicus]
MALSRPVVVVTELDDLTADLVITELHGRGVPVVRFDPGQPGAVTFSAYAGAGRSWHGPLVTPTRAFGLDDARAVYYRRPSPYTAVAGLDAQEREFATAQARHGLGGLLAALPDCLYVNHPHRNAGAESKPRQIAMAARAGLEVPPTLITNDPDAARAFASEHGPVVYKPLRSTEYRQGGEPRTIWVRPVDAGEIGDGVAACPHLFQQVVRKTADIRVAAVGRELFATRITIDGDHLDWRLDYDRLTFARIDVPGPVRSGIHTYLDAFGLAFGAFDFALGHDGVWRFYECNPNGQWAFVDDHTTKAIATALTDLLEKGLPT